MPLISFRRLTILALALGVRSLVAVNPAAAQGVPPVCHIDGAALTCGPTALCAVLTDSTAGHTYAFRWTGPDNFTSSSRCINVFKTGFNNTFTVIVTDVADASLSCTDNISIKSLFRPPCSITGTPVTCGGATMLCAPEGPDPNDGSALSYRWTGPGGFTSTDRCIVVSTIGDYSLTVFNASCDTTCTMRVVPGEVPCTITGRTRICPTNDATTLCGPDGLTYSWTGPGGFTSSQQCITTSTPGPYSLTTSFGPCSSTCSVTVDTDTICGTPSEGRCWMTGGGHQFSGDRNFSWGGNVNPGCKPDEGNWNHIDHQRGLHFQGRDIHVVRCGNVPGIPAGSTSPKTPFNFIEFTGPGIFGDLGSASDGKSKGNGPKEFNVFFFARVEDRAEPGSSGQPDINARDRYYLHVYTNPADPNGSTVYLVDQDGDPSTVDGVIIDHGNLQLHENPCQKFGFSSGRPTDEPAGQAVANGTDGVWFASPGPNPTRDWSDVSFGLPRGAQVSLKVFDVTGRQVRDLVSGDFSAGEHSIIWDLSDDAQSPVRGGVYFLRLAVGNKIYSKPLTVIR